MAGWLATGAMLVIAAGCGGEQGISVKVAPVTGTVRYQGVPVAGAWVQFTQEDCPIRAGGFTDDAGEFVLTSYREGDGAPVGENQVAISIPAGAADSEEFDAKQAETDEIGDAGERRAKSNELTVGRKKQTLSASSGKSRNQIPKRYSSPATSKLSCTVQAGTQNECSFDLIE
ncbi:MAG TPA: hypothetical protein VGH74_14995 [Planctomycetaceae bacterium]